MFSTILTIIGAIALVIFWIYIMILRKYETSVIETEIINIEPIIKKQAENTGYSVGYGKHVTYHEHYRYRNVKVGDRVTFKVRWKNGNVNTITCKKDGETYLRLIQKRKM